MHLDLNRWYLPEETFGILELVETSQRFYTIEKPWRDNVPFQSCIPEGNYFLEMHDTNKYPDTWAIVGGTVSHSPSQAFERYACLFHTANLASQVEGCVGPGLGAQFLKGSVATLQSGNAMIALKLALEGPLRHTITIRQSGIATWG